ncbi:MAG: hypothetical protein JXA15_11690 [Spirochaetales bacterium]|nr:hypothetical protein [Spirochaetales bacterium]
MLKYPLVLVHGIAAVDRWRGHEFWGPIPAALRVRGVEPRFGRTDSWGGLDSNAAALASTVDRVLRETGADRVNIVAHSKGGIDARAMIHSHGYGDRVASLTTVCTPHRGAELADLALRPKGVHSPFARRALRLFGRFFGDGNPDPYEAVRQLSTESMARFNAEARPDPAVRYRSLYTVMENPFEDALFFLSNLYLARKAGRNDGIVSAASARWGPESREIRAGKRGISHGAVVGMSGGKSLRDVVAGIYVSLLEELAAEGF